MRRSCACQDKQYLRLSLCNRKRMLTRIKHYNVLGWIRARLLSKTEDGRVANLMYLKGAWTVLIIGRRGVKNARSLCE